MLVPCGRCIACLRRRQNSWALRILYESSLNAVSYFVTLTYKDEFLTYSGDKASLVPSDVTLFFKRLRKKISFRYFYCGEYGDKFERPHYHVIFFLKDFISQEDFTSLVQSCWHYNDPVLNPVDVHILSPALAKYCAKYSCKRFGIDYDDVCPPFGRSSRRPGLGHDYFIKNKGLVNRIRGSGQYFLSDDKGTPYSIPRYLRPFLYSDDEYKRYVEKCEFDNYCTDMSNIELSQDPHRYYLNQIESLISYESIECRDLGISPTKLKKFNYGTLKMRISEINGDFEV